MSDLSQIAVASSGQPSLRQRLIRVLDRPGGRWLLGAGTTWYSRRKTRFDSRIFYDDVWMHGVGGVFLADGARFDYSALQFAEWRPGLADVLETRRDWWFRQYQPQLGDVIVDVGAGVGEDVLLFAQAVGAHGRVLAVEAHPQTFRCLQKTIQWNGLTNTTPVWSAVADQRGQLYIQDGPASQTNTISQPRPAGQLQHAVPALTLDELCAEQQITQINFLKMNIEGAEQLALAGMAKIVARTRYVCIACHDFLAARSEFYRTKSLVIEFLQDHGFAVETRDHHPEPWTRDHVCGMKISP